MKPQESEYLELFLAEALENFEELNKLFIDLEKKHSDKNAINSIFRITHTLKGNAMGMGLDAIAELSHVMEDVMGAIKNGTIELNKQLFESLFRANDKLGALIKALETGEKVSYLGIKTKLSVFLQNSIEEEPETEDSSETTEEKAEPVEEPAEEEMAEIVEASSDGQGEEISKITFTDVIQIPIKKMDEMMNLVGQLAIERDRLVAVSALNGKTSSEFEGLKRIISNLQYGVMNARMVQMGFLFNKFHRIVRDVASIEKKEVNLILKGTEIEIDRNILKVMSDSLIHLVRNAVSHGIESADVRKERKKSTTGTITLDARYERDNVVIMVSDDGNGIDADIIRKKIVEKKLVSTEIAKNLSDQEVIMHIFEPGFSNAEKVTEISGRGVGMDVVKKAVESIGGQVTVDTKVGSGSTVNLFLPSSLALKGALLFELSDQEYAVPLSYTEAVVTLKKDDIHKLGQGLMSKYLEKTISVVFLKDLMEMHNLDEIKETGILHKTFDQLDEEENLDVIIVSYSGKLTGIVIDKFLQQKEIFEKNLPKPLDKTKLLSGTTILGSGKVCPVIDIAAISDLLYKSVTQNA